MIQEFALNSRLKAPRRAAALVLAFVLNMALVPCVAAIEVVADEHDCCPPELRLESADCCEVNDGSIQSRVLTFEFDDGDEVSPAPEYAALVPADPGYYAAAKDPPEPPDSRADLNALYCVYLK